MASSQKSGDGPAAAAAPATPPNMSLREEAVQEKFQAYALSYPMKVPFPATVVSSDDEKSLRTESDFVQHKLLESGILFDDAQTLGELSEGVANFVAEMDQTSSYKSVQVVISDPVLTADGSTKETPLQVVLEEKNWYKLYMGGGIKHEGGINNGGSGLGVGQAKLQFETSASLINLTGHCDQTALSYTVDQASTTSLSVTHDRPFYTVLPPYGYLYNTLMSRTSTTDADSKPSQINLQTRMLLDTLDYEFTRSYKEWQRVFGLTLGTTSSGRKTGPMADRVYRGLDWTATFRDVVPRRHATLPYELDCSPEIAKQVGPNWKHSIVYEENGNQTQCNDPQNPTSGYDWHGRAELAGPPGDVGFFKIVGGGTVHLPLWRSLTLHTSLNGGILQPLTYGGLCPSSTTSHISDRFFVGGPLQLRGFLPSGIGPRAATGGSSTPGGDALGGDFFYTATMAASIPFPGISFLRDNGVRLMAFGNMGTLTGLGPSLSWESIARSSRAAVGGGLTVGTAFGRLEATYAIPLRYSPRDARRSVQAGLGFTFG
eukprot:scaffold70086_cov49-Attheya_sp.AAC.2